MQAQQTGNEVEDLVRLADLHVPDSSNFLSAVFKNVFLGDSGLLGTAFCKPHPTTSALVIAYASVDIRFRSCVGFLNTARLSRPEANRVE